MTAKLPEGTMSTETKGMIKIVILLSLLGIVATILFTGQDSLLSRTEMTFEWLKATKIIFGL